MPEHLEPISPKMPKYKRFQKEILAWLFCACMELEITETSATLILEHLRADFLRTFQQLIRLGSYTTSTYNRGTPYWQLKNLNEMTFFLKTITPIIRVRQRKKLAQLLIEFCKSPNPDLYQQIKKINKPVRLPSGYY